MATFSNLVIDTTGSYNLIASDGGLPASAVQSVQYCGAGDPARLHPAAEQHLCWRGGQPSVAVSLEDGFGNVATSNTSTVTLTLNGGTFFGGGTTATAAAVNGVASFNNLVVTAAGTYTFTATDSGLPSTTSYVVHDRDPRPDDHRRQQRQQHRHDSPGCLFRPHLGPVADFVWRITSAAPITSDSTGGDTATVTFTGTLITLYAVESPTGGSAQIFIDGNAPAQVDLSNSTTMIAPVFTSPLLTPGSHTIVVKVVSGNVAIDDFVVGPATPTIAWATPADLIYGTALDGHRARCLHFQLPPVSRAPLPTLRRWDGFACRPEPDR